MRSGGSAFLPKAARDEAEGLGCVGGRSVSDVTASRRGANERSTCLEAGTPHFQEIDMRSLVTAASAALFTLAVTAAPALAVEPMKNDSMKKEDSMKKDEMKKDSMHKDSMHKDEMKKDSMKKN